MSLRWIATCYYRTDVGLVDIEHEFDELSELEIIVERGPSFYTIDRIEIRTKQQIVGMTIERALAE